MSRRLVAALAAVALLVAAIAAVAQAQGQDAGDGAAAAEPGVGPITYRPCPEDVKMKSLRCARMRMPLERADLSMGTIPIAFAVRPPSDGSKPAKGTIFAIEGGPGYGSIGSAPYYRTCSARGCSSGTLVPSTCAAPATRRRSTARGSRGRRHRPPGGRAVRPEPRRHLRRLPDLGGRGRHRRRPPGAGDRPDHALRRLVRDLPRPVVRLSPRRRARRADPRQRLSAERREPLVSEPLAQRDPRPADRLRPHRRLRGQRQAPPATRRRAAAAHATRRRPAARRDRLRRIQAPVRNFLKIDGRSART